MKSNLLLLLIILLLTSNAFTQEDVVVSGGQPLTEKMIARYMHFVSTLYDLSLTPEQTKHLRDMLIGYWKNQKKAQMQDVLASLSIDVQLESKPEAERQLFFARARPQSIKDLRGQKNNPDAEWLVSLYDASHKPLAQGIFPLLKESVDAYADWIFFVVEQSGGIKQEPTDETRNRFAAFLVSTYPELSAEDQQRLSELPAFWRSVQLQWSQMKEPERENQRAEWRKQLQPLLMQQKKQSEGLKVLEQMATANAAQRTQLLNRIMTLASEISTLGGQYNQVMATILSDAASQEKAKTLTPAKNRQHLENYREQMQLYLVLYSGLRPW